MFRKTPKTKDERDLMESIDPWTLVEIPKGVRIFVSASLVVGGLGFLVSLVLTVRAAAGM